MKQSIVKGLVFLSGVLVGSLAVEARVIRRMLQLAKQDELDRENILRLVTKVRSKIDDPLSTTGDVLQTIQEELDFLSIVMDPNRYNA